MKLLTDDILIHAGDGGAIRQRAIDLAIPFKLVKERFGAQLEEHWLPCVTTSNVLDANRKKTGVRTPIDVETNVSMMDAWNYHNQVPAGASKEVADATAGEVAVIEVWETTV